MEDDESGEQDDGWNPEMNIGEYGDPDADGVWCGRFVRHERALALFEREGPYVTAVGA